MYARNVHQLKTNAEISNKTIICQKVVLENENSVISANLYRM